MYNDHWLPYWIHCQVCTQAYDIIGKMEYLEEDVRYIFDYANVSLSEFPWSNQVNHKKIDTFNLTKSYMKNLSDEQKYKLYQIYLPDFQMFEYDASKYL